MRLLGVENVDNLGLQHVRALFLLIPDSARANYSSSHQINTRMAEQQIYDGPSNLESLRQAFKAKL